MLDCTSSYNESLLFRLAMATDTVQHDYRLWTTQRLDVAHAEMIEYYY
jgi:hypothetical protein